MLDALLVDEELLHAAVDRVDEEIGHPQRASQGILLGSLSLLALAEGLVVVVVYDVKQRHFQLPLPTRRRRRLGSVHPVPITAGRRRDSSLSFFFLFVFSTQRISA